MNVFITVINATKVHMAPFLVVNKYVDGKRQIGCGRDKVNTYTSNCLDFYETSVYQINH